MVTSISTSKFLIRLTQKMIEKKDCRRKRRDGPCGVEVVVKSSLQDFDPELDGRRGWREGARRMERDSLNRRCAKLS